MSESFQSALHSVNFGKYIDQVQAALKKAVTEVGPGRTPQEAEAIQQRLIDVVKKQAMELAKEAGFSGNKAMVFMLSAAMISTAWVAYALKRETTDLSKSPEDRLAVIEMYDALDSALAGVIKSGGDYAER